MAGGQRLQVQAPAGASLLDLGADLGGRPARRQASAGTDVTLALDGLIGWQAGADSLRLVSWGAQAAAELAPVEDPVSTPVTFAWDAIFGPLLEAADRLWIGHYTLALPEGGGATGSFEYLEAQAATSVTGLAMVDGAPLDLSPPAALGTTLATVGVDWRRDAMEAAAAPFSPAAAGFAHLLGLYAVPAPLDSPSPLGGAAATIIEATQAPGAGDLLEPAVSIGRFLPTPLWREYHEVAFRVPVSRSAVDAATPLPATFDEVRAREAVAGDRKSVV